MTNNGNFSNHNNVAIIGFFLGENENHRTSIGKMSLDLPWFLLHVFLTDAEHNQEHHILSCHCSSQKMVTTTS